jgi:hypothetical protein
VLAMNPRVSLHAAVQRPTRRNLDTSSSPPPPYRAWKAGPDGKQPRFPAESAARTAATHESTEMPFPDREPHEGNLTKPSYPRID